MKNKFTAAILAILFGSLGFHKFYLWKWGQGILYIILCIITFWVLPAIIWILEGIIYLINNKDWFDIQYNAEYIRNKQIIDLNNKIWK